MSYVEDTYRSILAREQRIVALEQENAELKKAIGAGTGRDVAKEHKPGTVIRD